jgi:hypothetical protein
MLLRLRPHHTTPSLARDPEPHHPGGSTTQSHLHGLEHPCKGAPRNMGTRTDHAGPARQLGNLKPLWYPTHSTASESLPRDQPTAPMLGSIHPVRESRVTCGPEDAGLAYIPPGTHFCLHVSIARAGRPGARLRVPSNSAPLDTT